MAGASLISGHLITMAAVGMVQQNFLKVESNQKYIDEQENKYVDKRYDYLFSEGNDGNVSYGRGLLAEMIECNQWQNADMATVLQQKKKICIGE